MKLTYRKDAYYVLLLGGILTLIFMIPLAIDTAFDSWTNVLPVAYFLIEGVSLIIFALTLKKADPRAICRGIALYEIISSPFVYLIVLAMNFVVVDVTGSSFIFWMCYLMDIMMLVMRVFMWRYFNSIIKQGDDGYVAMRNHSWMAATLFGVITISYTLGMFKNINFPMQDFMDILLAENLDLSQLPLHYVILTIAGMLLVVIAFFITLYVSISTLISAKEDKLVDLHSNAEYAKAIFKKYNVFFWFGIIVTGAMMIVALVSMITINWELYIGLFLLYFVVIAIRVPTFFWEQKINKLYFDDTTALFKERHKVVLYVGIALLAYAIAAIVFGVSTDLKVKQSTSEFLLFIFFVPWCLFKLYGGITGFVKSRKSGDPSLYMVSRVDFVIALFTLSNTLFLLANNIGVEWFTALGLIVVLLMTFYCLFASIQMIIAGARGIRGKRTKVESKFAVYMMAFREKLGMKEKEEKAEVKDDINETQLDDAVINET